MRALWRRLKFAVVLLILIAVVIVGILLDLENNTLASLSLFGWETPRITLFRWLSLALLLGFLLGWCFSFFDTLGLRVHRRRVQRQLERTEAEVRELRSLPLQD